MEPARTAFDDAARPGAARPRVTPRGADHAGDGSGPGRPGGSGAAAQPEPDARVAKAADVFHLLGDGTRLRIVLACLDAPKNVGAIAEAAGASASLVSHHLRLLKAGDLVRAERRGREVYYHAADAHVRCIVSDMMAHVSEDGAEGRIEERAENRNGT